MKKATFLIVLLTLFCSWSGTSQNSSNSSSENVKSSALDLSTAPDSDVPHGISPNDDKINDTFDLTAFNVVRIEIFSRLGRLVYSKNNYTNEWYGQSDKGDELPVGTYYFSMVYDGGDKTMSSWVYINR